MNLGLKYCSLSLLDWNAWSTISGTITSVLFEAPGLNLDSVHTEWEIKWETITAWWLPLWEVLESHREKREFALPNSWVAKPIVGGLGKNLIFSLSGLSFFFDAWVELFHPTKGRLKLHSQRVELHITPSLLWSCQQITGVYRGCHLQGREGAMNSKAQVVLCKLLYSLGLVLLVCEMGITLVPQDCWEG